METNKELNEKYNPEGSNLRYMQLRMLNILNEVDRICNKHNIQYWIASGTLLGAVRHGGFIPWDDDLDIEIMRNDYFKLLAILKTELPDSMILQTHETDENYFMTFAKVRDLNSEIIEIGNKDINYQYRGIYIDIFPMEYTNYHLSKISSYLNYFIIGKLSAIKNDKLGIKKNVTNILFHSFGFLYNAFRLINSIYPSKYISYSYGVYFPLRCSMNILLPITKILFEEQEFNAPHDPISYLKNNYGDYMSLPSKENRMVHTEYVNFNS